MAHEKDDPRPGPLVTTFSTHEIAAEHRFEAWREVMKASHDVAAPPASFDASVRTVHLGRMLLHEITTSGQSVDRAARRIGADGLEHLVLQLNTVPMQGVSGERTIQVPAGAVVVSALSQPLRRHHVRDADAVVVSLSRDCIVEVLPEPELFHGAVLVDGAGPILRDHLRSLTREVRKIPREVAPDLARSTALLLAAGLKPEQRRIHEARHALNGVALFRARRFIDANVRTPTLTPETVAAAVGVSQRSLYRLFAPVGGVAAFIRSRRLQAARAVLTESAGRKRIAEVAYAHGFTDPAQFSRSIRAAFGCSPRELMNEPTSLLVTARPASGDDYRLWVKALG